MARLVDSLLYRRGVLKHELGRDGLLAALRAERLKANQEKLALQREIRKHCARIDELNERLRDIDHAEGTLR